MDFGMVALTSPKEHLEQLKNEEQIDVDYITTAIKNGIKILPYSRSMTSDEDEFYYEDYIDDKFNFYTIFVDLKDKSFKCGYKYSDENMEWTTRVDNQYYGNPLTIDYDMEMAKDLFPNESIKDALEKVKELNKAINKAFSKSIEEMFSNFASVDDIPWGERD